VWLYIAVAMSDTNQAFFTVNAILDRYEAECFSDLAPRTRKDYARHLISLRRCFGERIADELRPRDFGPFLNVQKGKHHRTRQLAVLSAAFSNAVGRWFMMERNVLRDVKRPLSRPRDRLITDEEFSAFRAMVPYRVQLAMDMALISGQRQGDILGLRWSDVRDGALLLSQAKTGKRLAIELSGDLKRVFGKCWMLPGGGRDGGLFILVSARGKPYSSDGFRAVWQRSMRKWAAMGRERFTFHDIRALCATKCPSIEYAMYLLGHSNISMTRRVYRRGVERVKPLSLMQ
jgi:integrase